MYAFCETVTAGSGSPWHIRELVNDRKYPGGGCDSRSLCGREVSWDVPTSINPFALKVCCAACREKYEDLCK